MLWDRPGVVYWGYQVKAMTRKGSGIRRDLKVALVVLVLIATYVLVAFRSPGARLAHARAERREAPGWVPVPILAYHEIADGPSPIDLSPRDFALELRYLARAGYSPVTLDQVYRAVAHRTPLPGHPIVLTFDDGYESFYRSAFPLLQRYHYPATVFVSTGLVGRPGYLTWDQIRELDQAGIEIGAHTVNHPDLRGLDDTQLRSEISGSREVLFARLGHAPAFFAYPYGALNPRVVDAVRRAGFLAAVTGRPGAVGPSQDPFLWPRNVVVRGTGYWRLGRLLRRALQQSGP